MNNQSVWLNVCEHVMETTRYCTRFSAGNNIKDHSVDNYLSFKDIQKKKKK